MSTFLESIHSKCDNMHCILLFRILRILNRSPIDCNEIDDARTLGVARIKFILNRLYNEYFILKTMILEILIFERFKETTKNILYSWN